MYSYSINSTEEFECKNENKDWTIIKNIAQDISNILPKSAITLQSAKKVPFIVSFEAVEYPGPDKEFFVTMSFTKKEWTKKRDESKLKFVIPTKGIKEDEQIKLRDILKSTSGSKTNFMYSVIINKKAEKTEPDYIQGGLKWLME